MELKNFKNKDELICYLEEINSPNTIFLDAPDFIKSIMGISVDNRLIYNYTNMVESLYLDYIEWDSKDPYTDAIEWIDFNVCTSLMGPLSPIISYELPPNGLDGLYETDGVDDFFLPFSSYVIGIDNKDEILLDFGLSSELKEKVEEFIKDKEFVSVKYV